MPLARGSFTDLFSEGLIKKVTFEQRLEEGEEIVPADILEKNVPSRGAGPEAGPCAGCLKNEEARVAGATEHGKQ